MIEIEVDSSNRSLYFAPLNRVVRGAFDFNKVAEPSARLVSSRWPQPIPGQRIGIDPKSGEAWVSDPLHDPGHQATREAIERRGNRLPPAREEFQGVHVASWLHRMQAAVNAGCAKLVKGQFPDKLPGKPIESFLMPDRPDPAELQLQILGQLAAAVEKLADAVSTIKGGK